MTLIADLKDQLMNVDEYLRALWMDIDESDPDEIHYVDASTHIREAIYELSLIKGASE